MVVIALGACACAAAQSPALPGNYHDTYAQVGDLAHLVPVDVYVPGCPPRLEDLRRDRKHAARHRPQRLKALPFRYPGCAGLAIFDR